MRMKEKIAIVWKLIYVLIGFTALGINIFTADHPIVLFYFFTIIMNVICILTFLLLLVNPKLELTVFRGGITVGMLLVMLVFHFMLRPTSDYYAQEMQFYDMAFHYILPIMVIIDFAVFVPHNHIKVYEPFRWLVLPVFYLLFVFVRAAVGKPFETGYGISSYPYYFLDVETMGVGNVLLWILALLVLYLILGYITFGFDRLCGRICSSNPN